MKKYFIGAFVLLAITFAPLQVRYAKAAVAAYKPITILSPRIHTILTKDTSELIQWRNADAKGKPVTATLWSFNPVARYVLFSGITGGSKEVTISSSIPTGLYDLVLEAGNSDDNISSAQREVFVAPATHKGDVIVFPSNISTKGIVFDAFVDGSLLGLQVDLKDASGNEHWLGGSSKIWNFNSGLNYRKTFNSDGLPAGVYQVRLYSPADKSGCGITTVPQNLLNSFCHDATPVSDWARIVMDAPSAKPVSSHPSTTPKPKPAKAYNPIGYFDAVNCSVISGWTCDQNDFNTPLRVDVYSGAPAGRGNHVVSDTANVKREAGVGARCGGNPAHGFNVPTPSILKDNKTHDIYVYGINIGPGANKLLGHKKMGKCS